MNLSLLNTLNRRAAAIASDAAEDPLLKIDSVDGYGGASVFNFSSQGHGTIAAGLKLAEICMAGLGEVAIAQSASSLMPWHTVNVSTDQPLLACMAAQYAGWPLADEDFFAMCSGPARALRGEEKVLLEYDLVHSAAEATAVLETNQLPPQSVVEDCAKQCAVELENVTLCIARTASLPGMVQVVARSVETALHKLHELGFDLATINSGHGWAPLPPLPPLLHKAHDDLTALGWTNDAILYGAKVNLSVETTDEAIEEVIDKVPSSASADFGTPFLEIFNRYDKDFYKIDKLLFSPAQITIENVSTGRVFQSGELRNDILMQSYSLSSSGGNA